MIENCGMADEQIYERLEDIPEHASYYSLLIVKRICVTFISNGKKIVKKKMYR